MVHAPDSEKATRYIADLDRARCEGRWKDVPEACRKVEKHAPHRSCLTLTARSEAQISVYSAQRPSTAASTTSVNLSQIIPSLLTAIEKGGDYPQDAFQATVCLGWLHYVLDEPGLAVARLPQDFGAVASNWTSQGATLSGWTRVCIVKGAFVKGSSQDKTGSVEDAVQTYSSIVPWLSSMKTLGAESSLFRSWTERLLVRLCQLSDQSTETGAHADPVEALRAYRIWANYWDAAGKTAGDEGMARHRRSAWKAYYNTLSSMLRHNSLHIADPTIAENNPSTNPEKPLLQQPVNARMQQRAELKRVETVYEGLLLKETPFPKASENNFEIEAWTDSVMDNWRFLCGPKWTDADLGEGGKEAVGRGVLDILYRAAMKTFHSTQILRHLFTVHASLAEFDLAFKAYDSYVEIVTRGKDRAEKSGEEDLGIDDDNMVLRTSAEAIRILCRFGARKDAEKAMEISNNMEKWLEPSQHIEPNGTEGGSSRFVESAVAPRALAVAFSAIGVCQAHWARYTYSADLRATIQKKSVQYLRKSLEPKFEEADNIETLYALALVLAEMRDIPAAIKEAKRALSPATRQKAYMSTDGVLSGGVVTEFGRERKLIPVWHLLALLLTTRSEFSAAEKACEAAFEQFGDPTTLFGKENENGTYRSDHLNEASGRTTNAKVSNLVDQMESFERGGILEIKMTQLALVEVMEGPDAAVDSCDELLALYTRLFGDPTAEKSRLQPPAATIAPPKSAIGTVKGSMFRSRGSVKGTQRDSTLRNSPTTGSHPSAEVAQVNAAPTIQVTEDHGAHHGKSHHHHLPFHHKHEDEKTGVTRSPSKLLKRSSNSLRRRSEIANEQSVDVPGVPVNTTNGPPARSNTVRTKSPRRSSMSSSIRKSIESNDRQLRPIAHNMSHTAEPLPSGHTRQPPKQDVRLATPFPGADYIPPDPHFSQIQIRRHKVTLLVDIWGFICRLYTRAGMFDDAKGAVNEALKLAETFEAEVAQGESSSKAFADRGWGGGRSVEKLWADAFTARGELLVAQSLKHEGRADFERAVLHFPDHPEAIVSLSNILLDIYCQIIPLEATQASETFNLASPASLTSTSGPSPLASEKPQPSSHTPSAQNQLSPPELNRLAARDRAFGLLSTVTKLGAGWDYSEAWYALARAYEESGQIDKTKEVLWWCVGLEDTHPLRSWKHATPGGFVL